MKYCCGREVLSFIFWGILIGTPMITSQLSEPFLMRDFLFDPLPCLSIYPIFQFSWKPLFQDQGRNLIQINFPAYGDSNVPYSFEFHFKLKPKESRWLIAESLIVLQKCIKQKNLLWSMKTLGSNHSFKYNLRLLFKL